MGSCLPRQARILIPSLVAIVNVKIQTSNHRVLYNIFPNNFPASRYAAQKESDDDGIVEFVQVRFPFSQPR